MKTSSFQKFFLALLLCLYLPTVNAQGITCNPTPSVMIGTKEELIECLQDLQRNIASELIAISNFAPSANPEGMKTEVATLSGWEVDVLVILLDAETNGLITPKQQKALMTQYGKLFNFVSKAADLLEKSQPSSVVMAQIRNANNSHNLTGKAIAGLGGGTPPIPTLAASGPSFYGANHNVCFTISNCPPPNPIDVSIDNPFFDLGIFPIKPGSVTQSDLKNGKRKVCVVTGDSQGGGSVAVGACGTVLRRLIYNYGNSHPDVPGAPGTPVAAKDYVGTCTGGYRGSYTIHYANGDPDDMGPVMGSVAATLTNGKITITDPGSGGGSVAGNGKATARSSGFLDFAPGIFVTWSGSFWFAADSYESGGSTATGSGGWSTRIRFPGGSGSASGGWNVGCN